MFPQQGFLKTYICKFILCIIWVYLHPSSLVTLGTHNTPHYWHVMWVLLNLLINFFCNILLNLIWAVTLCVEPVHVIYGRVGTSPALQGLFDPTYLFSYMSFRHTHIYRHSLPNGIICVWWSGNWCLFLLHTGRHICCPMHFSAWGHYSHWRLLPWVFNSCCCRFFCILLQCFHCHIFYFPVWNLPPYPAMFIEGIPLMVPMNILGWRLPTTG